MPLVKEALENSNQISRIKIWPLPNASRDRRTFAVTLSITACLALVAVVVNGPPETTGRNVSDYLSMLAIPPAVLSIVLLCYRSRRAFKEPGTRVKTACARVGVNPRDLWLPPVTDIALRLLRQAVHYARRFWPVTAGLSAVIILWIVWPTARSDINSGVLAAFGTLAFAGLPLALLGVFSSDSTVRERVENQLLGVDRIDHFLELQTRADALEKKSADQRTMSIVELNGYIEELQVDNKSLLALVMTEVQKSRDREDRRDRKATRQQFLYFVAGLIVSFPLGLLAAWEAKRMGIG